MDKDKIKAVIVFSVIACVAYLGWLAIEKWVGMPVEHSALIYIAAMVMMIKKF